MSVTAGYKTMTEGRSGPERSKAAEKYGDRSPGTRGRFIAVLGLDGSGKSTLIDLACREIERIMDIKTEKRHLRPGLFPSLARLFGRGDKEFGPVLNPHARPPQGLFSSVLRLAYYTMDYLFGYWLCLYPTLFKKKTVIFIDRYYYDYYIDPARYLVSAPKWVIKMFEFFVPKPDLTIMLVPHPEVFHSRKPELSVSELHRQAERMREFATEFKEVVWIDTADEIEISRQKMLQAVMKSFNSEESRQ